MLSSFSFDAAPSYFDEASDRNVLRQITFEHDAALISIEDRVELPEGLADFQLPLHVSGDCEVTAGPAGEIILTSNAGFLKITLNNLTFTGVETVEMNDPRHCEIWGGHIKRVWLKAANLHDRCFSLSIARN